MIKFVDDHRLLKMGHRNLFRRFWVDFSFVVGLAVTDLCIVDRVFLSLTLTQAFCCGNLCEGLLADSVSQTIDRRLTQRRQALVAIGRNDHRLSHRWLSSINYLGGLVKVISRCLHKVLVSSTVCISVHRGGRCITERHRRWRLDRNVLQTRG